MPKLTKEYIFALDDSGGVEPLIKRGQPVAGDHPFCVVSAIGINSALRDEFNEQWNSIREDIANTLGTDELPSIHARLMFGKTKPPKYRGKPNPYLLATNTQIIEWFYACCDVIGWATQFKRGGCILSAAIDRAEGVETWMSALETEASKEESEFLKTYQRRRHPKLYKKYIAHASSALTMPTIDAMIMINRAMMHIDSDANLLLDNYSDADGFNDEQVFNFLDGHLSLDKIRGLELVPNPDNEPLMQAADIAAYVDFRTKLHGYRSAEDASLRLEDWVIEARRRMSGRKFVAVDLATWMVRHRAQPKVKRLVTASQYAVAYYEISQYAPQLVSDCLLTPDEFFLQMEKAHAEARLKENGKGIAYRPIVREECKERWRASRKGEDRS